MTVTHSAYANVMNRRWFFRLPTVLCFLYGVIYIPHLQADRLYVAVASNFRPVVRRLVVEYKKHRSTDIKLIIASSGKLYAQIIHGANFDMFFSADSVHPELLEKNGTAVKNSRFTYAVGKLVLWAEGRIPIDGIKNILASDTIDHIALANPKLAPYGEAAIRTIKKLNVWTQISPKLVYGENIAQAFHFIRSRNADIGFIALSQYIHYARKTRGTMIRIPQNLYPPIVQQAVLLNDSDAARHYFNFMKSQPVKSIIRSLGYGTPE